MVSAGALAKPPSTASPGAPPTSQWLLDFFKSELAPYPGRISLVLRMTAAATIAMLCIMAGHLPSGALGGYFALIISRESLRNTVRQTLLTILCLGLATLYIILGAALFVASPVTHFLWVIVSFFGMFFLLGTVTNYSLAAGSSFVLSGSIPLWDQAGSTNVKLALTLYSFYTISIGALSALLVESIYHLWNPRDPILAGLRERLETAAAMLEAASRGQLMEPASRKRLVQFALTGPSGLRRELIRSHRGGDLRARVAAVIAASGRLVELCAAALQETAAEAKANPKASTSPATPDQAARLRATAGAVRQQAAALQALRSIAGVGASRLPHWDANDAPFPPLPTLPEIEHTIALFGGILDSFGSQEAQQARGSEEAQQSGNSRGSQAARDTSADSSKQTPSKRFQLNALVPDAFTDPSHLVFAMRGCLAASLCFLIYNGVNWPGISTSVTTCFVTALSTVGSSRQKQTLRIGGAFTGGFLIALPAQVYILPHLDSITGFTLLFVCVTALAAWFASSSPKLSYFGLQIAIAFDLVNLQEPFEQLSLAVARDRVVGILLGLGVMGLAFNQIAAPKATERMEQLLRQNLLRVGRFGSLVGELTRSPQAVNRAVNQAVLVREIRLLRDEINDTFSQMNAQADAVAFEFGPGRAARLQLRERMQAMQPPLRSLFLLQIALFEADHPHPGAPSPGPDKPALQAFLGSMEKLLQTIAASSSSENTQLASLQRLLPAVEAEAGEHWKLAASLCARIASSAATLTHQASRALSH